MRILLTGGSGFIGSEIRKRLGKALSFDNFDIRQNPKDDVRDLARLMQAVRNVDGVLHLAAISRPKWGYENPHLCLDTNIRGTFNVLEAVRRENPKAWVILGSSREVFGNLKKFPATEESPRNPLNAYAVSKVAGEDLLQQYAKNYGLRCLTIRFCGVYSGLNDIQDRVVPRFIGQALAGIPVTLEGNREKKYDLVYIGDGVDAVEKSIKFISKKTPGFYENITLSANNPVSLHDLARNVISLAESKSRIVLVPNRSYDQDAFWGSFAKARKLLNWQPRMPLQKGLSRVIKEFKTYHTGQKLYVLKSPSGNKNKSIKENAKF